MRVCIAFFGLSRSLAWTHRSIIENIINPVKKISSSVYVCAHFNSPSDLISSRSGEQVKKFKNSNLGCLPLDYLILESQKQENITDLKAIFLKHDLECGDLSGSTHSNLVFQYRSLAAIFEHIKIVEAQGFDAYIFVRPDLQYLDPLPISQAITSLLEKRFDILTPSWHQWGGLNDRISVCNSVSAAAYCSRLNQIQHVVSLAKPMNAEKILKLVIDEGGLVNGSLGIRAVRVRANGYTVNEGFDLSLSLKLRFFKRRVFGKIFAGFF